MDSLLAAGKKLLRGYVRAWVTRDSSTLEQIFLPEALYYTSPLAQPLRGIKRIQEYWNTKVRPQSRIRIRIEGYSRFEGRFVIVWRATFRKKPNRKRIALNGVMFWKIRRKRIAELLEYYFKHTADTPRVE